jgi:hypothetical protein
MTGIVDWFGWAPGTAAVLNDSPEFRLASADRTDSNSGVFDEVGEKCWACRSAGISRAVRSEAPPLALDTEPLVAIATAEPVTAA